MTSLLFILFKFLEGILFFELTNVFILYFVGTVILKTNKKEALSP